MDRLQILKRLTDIFIDVLDCESLSLVDATTASDVEGWDSLTHIQLVVAIEKHFKVRFTAKEIQSWQNLGEMIDCLQSKIE